MTLLVGLAVGIYHFAGVTEFARLGKRKLSEVMMRLQDGSKAHRLKVILPIAAGGDLAFVWACPQKEPSA